MSSKWQSCDSTQVYLSQSPCSFLYTLLFLSMKVFCISNDEISTVLSPLSSLKHLTSSKHKSNIHVAARFPNLKFEFHLSLCFSLQLSGETLNPHLISTYLFSLNVSEGALSLRKATVSRLISLPCASTAPQANFDNTTKTFYCNDLYLSTSLIHGKLLQGMSKFINFFVLRDLVQCVTEDSPQ